MAGFLSNLFNKKSKQEIERQYYLKNPNGTSLTVEQQYGISLGLILSERNEAYCDSLETGLEKSEEKNFLTNSWRISNREDALDFLSARSGDYGHRQLFNALLDIYIKQDCADADDIDFDGTEFADMAEDVRPYLKNLDEIYELDDDWFSEVEDDFAIGADAWDFGRVVFVSRMCYCAGYITESEAWGYISHVTKLTRKKFDNWEDYAKSYLLGRAMWIGDDGEWDMNDGFASGALHDKDSPWNKLAW